MHQFSESQTKVPWSAIILKIVIFIRICMVNGQGMPVQLVCHTKPYNNCNFQIDGALQYFGVWLWQLVHLLLLVYSFQWCVLFLCLAKWAVLSVIKVHSIFEIISDPDKTIVLKQPIGPFRSKFQGVQGLWYLDIINISSEIKQKNKRTNKSIVRICIIPITLNKVSL